MISVAELCRKRVKDNTNLSNTILLPIVVQVYKFHKNRKSCKRKSFELVQTKKQQERLFGKIYKEIIITHTALAYSEPSQTSKMKPFAEKTEY